MDGSCIAQIFSSRKLNALAYTIHTNTHRDINIIHMHMHARTHMHACTHTCVRARTHACTHAHTHILWSAYICGNACWKRKVFSRALKSCIWNRLRWRILGWNWETPSHQLFWVEGSTFCSAVFLQRGQSQSYQDHDKTSVQQLPVFTRWAALKEAVTGLLDRFGFGVYSIIILCRLFIYPDLRMWKRMLSLEQAVI